MAYADLDRALACCRALRELVIHHPGGWADTGSLAEVRRLCGAVAAAVEDAECKAPLAAIEEHAADLFSESDHRKWTQRAAPGADILRLRMLRELDWLRARLHELEAARDAAMRPWPGAEGRQPRRG
jgi:hypothetical protein